jgi:cytochrome d ubiquinol oxidase subunit I
MAMEGHFESHPDGAPLYLFGLPNQETRRVDYAIAIPHLGSLILKHDPHASMPGLDTVPDQDEPPVAVVFWSFRIMVGLGLAMLAIGLWSLLGRLRGRLYEWKWLHRAALLMGPSGFVAVIAGWVTTEVGRQPFTVYGLLRTAHSASPLDAPAVAASLVAFIVVYFAVFGVGTWYIFKLMSAPPHAGEGGIETSESGPVRTAGTVPGPAQHIGGEGGR